MDNTTIICVNINKKILNFYKDYHIIDDNFNLEDLLKYPKVLFFNVLNNLPKSKLESIFKFLKDNNINFVNVTNNPELSFYATNLVVYDEDKIIINGKTLEVLENEKLLKRLGIKLPFMVELSLLLKDYNLINKIYTDKKELEDALWP